MSRTKSRLKIEYLWGLTVLVGIFMFVNTHPIRPHDFWWHIAAGRQIVQTGHIPTTDIYSFTQAGQPYPSYKMYWLMETAMYLVYDLGGPALVVFFQSLLITAAYAVLFHICKKISNSWRITTISVLFAAALGINDWNVRPQAITFLLASLILLAIYSYRQKPAWGWLMVLPVCMIIWTNTHGTFIIGLVLIGIWWAQELWTALRSVIRREALTDKLRVILPGVMLLISALACLINPQGITIINYLRNLTGNSVVQNLVTEWAPPTFNSLLGGLFFSGLILSVIILVISPKRPDLFQMTTLVLFGLLSIRTSRGSVWFGIVMAPILADHLAVIVQRYRKTTAAPERSEGSPVLNAILLIFILLLGLISLPWFKNYLPMTAAKAGLISVETPVESTKVLLEKDPPGKLFNSMSFGSYLIWAAYPEYQVFIDSRIELFPGKDWLDYLQISNAEGDWEAMLEGYGVNTLLLSPIEQPRLVQAVTDSGAWELLYQDASAILFQRK